MSNKFKVTLKGGDSGNSIRLSDLVDELNAIKQNLNHLDAQLNDGKSSGLSYRITKITMNSPATFEIEVVDRAGKVSQGNKVVSKLSRDIQAVIRGKRPKSSDLEQLETFKALVKPMQGRLEEISFQFGDDKIPLPRNLDVKIDDILGPDHVERGSVIGKLDTLDLHDGRNLIKIYPVVGPKSIRCRFPESIKPQVKAGVECFVRISGLMHYKKAEKFCHLINVAQIEILPDVTERPSLIALRGIAPEAYSGLNAVEHVERVRNGGW
jgi:hypothetical protein